MTPLLRAGTILLFCGTVAACSGTSNPPPPAAEAATPPATPPTGFDGTYAGILTRVRTPTPRACMRSRTITLTIANGTATYRQSRSVIYAAPLAADGSFTATANGNTMKAQAAGGAVTGSLDGERCGYSFDLKKRS